MSFQTDPERNELHHVRKFIDFAGKRVLEIGCGEGRLTWQYASSAKLVVGVDTDRNALRVATYDRPADLKNAVLFSNARSEHLPFHKETFDIAVLSWSL